MHKFVILVTGLIVALMFCFIIYPRIQKLYHVVLDPDGYGKIGINLWQGYGFSFSPDDGPTVFRGPLYPAFIALFLFLTSGWYPGGIWVAQSFLHGFTCFFVYLIAKRFWNRTTALLAGFSCALYPMLFWYTPRIWSETLVIFLVIYLIYLCVRIIEKVTVPKAIGIGILLGLLCLVKATFLPLIVILPLCFFILTPRIKLASILLIAFVAVLLIIPWTIRNYMLVRKVIPVHTGAGFNLKMGNAYARDFFVNPFSYEEIWQKNIGQIAFLTEGITSPRPLRDIQEENIYMTSALSELRSDPSLLLRKILVNGLTFWYLGENRVKTLVILLLRIPIFILFFIGIYLSIKCKEIKLWPVIVVILTYWVCHLPFVANARLSAPIMSIVLTFAISNFYWFQQRQLKTESIKRSN